MDRPEVVVRVQLRHYDDLVQYLISEARGEVWGGFYPRHVQYRCYKGTYPSPTKEAQ
jgi:hypothetical protein